MTEHHMTCDAFADRLADYLEGDASGAERAMVETHAAACEPCGTLLADLLLIPQQAAALPALEPSRDLWAGIAERIDARVLPLAPRPAARPAPAWRRPAIAAAALIVFTAGVTHVLTRVSLSSSVATVPAASRQVASAVAAPGAGVPTAEITSTATEGTDEPRVAATSARDGGRERTTRTPVRLASATPLLRDAEPVYDREIVKLRRIVRDRHSQLDPATIAILEQSVAVIDSAIAQSRAALARDPASGFLATQLNHSLEKKVELLRTAATLPSRT